MSVLEAIQQQCADQLIAAPFFAPVPVLVEHLKDFQNEYERALGPLQVGAAGKIGICVTVVTPTANASFPDLGGPYFDEVKIFALVQENRAANSDPATGTGLSALTVAENVALTWAQFFPLAASGPLTPIKPTLLRAPDDEFVNYFVQFQCQAPSGAVPPQLALPQFTTVTAAGVTTATLVPGSVTPGAAVFVTMDGGNASPRNPTAILCLNPITAPVGTVLQARAWLAGYLTSETTKITL